MDRPRKGDILELPITALAFGGKGIGRHDEFVVFVAGAVPGDTARVAVTEVKKRYAEARLLELTQPSSDRRASRCPAFGTCGGCVWQSLDYEVQLRYKTQQVTDSLERLGGLRDFETLPILHMDDPWRYRNRVDFSIGELEGQPVVGFRPPGVWDAVLPVTECHLLPPAFENIRTIVEAWLRENNLSGWNSREHTGFARHLLIRGARFATTPELSAPDEGATDGREIVLSLVTVPAELPDAQGLVEKLRASHPEIVGAVHAVNAGVAEVATGLPSRTLWGRPFLLERVAGITVKISVDAFFQTNTHMAHMLYLKVAEEARDNAAARDSGPVVWDLFCGVGSIALSLAREARAVLGIELVSAAVTDANENARLNLVTNATFLEGDVTKILRDVAHGEQILPKSLENPDVIVVDPPRAGLAKKAVDRIGRVGAPRIVYVSCNPSTMAPNIAQFGEHGYRLKHVTPVDMFPHTPHIEAVGLLVREA